MEKLKFQKNNIKTYSRPNKNIKQLVYNISKKAFNVENNIESNSLSPTNGNFSDNFNSPLESVDEHSLPNKKVKYVESDSYESASHKEYILENHSPSQINESFITCSDNDSFQVKSIKPCPPAIVQPKRLKRNSCDATSRVQDDLEKRLSLQAEEELTKSLENFNFQVKNVNTYSRTKTKVKQFVCKFCDTSFTENFRFDAHFRWHMNNKWTCKNVPDTSDIEKLFFCKLCDEKFADDSSLQLHIETHTFQCDVCNETFDKAYQLDCHKLIHPTAEKRFSCGICSKKFYERSEMFQHCLSHNTGVKPFSCEVCKEKFSRKVLLKNHFLTHDNGKPFKCTSCDKSFASKNILTYHSSVHSDARPYVCEVCGKAFKRKGYLEEHYLTHDEQKNFICNVCDKAFYQKRQLLRHYREYHLKLNEEGVESSNDSSLHSKKNSYVCEMCQKAFKSKSALKYHYFTHNKDKDYTCAVCDKGFYQKGALTRHYRETHLNVELLVVEECNKGDN